MPLDPKRTVAELKELRELTGDDDGAQRVAWTDTWERAREWLRGLVASTGAVESIDAAGNQWFTLPGGSERAVLIGGHIDSVPNGGWLDGCLNVVAGVEVLRRVAEEGAPPVTVRLVNWADEEGARFGRSLFGSSAAAGSMADQDELRQLTDRDGTLLPDALAAHGVDLDSALDARGELDSAAAYLELHIEQGPVLESLDLPLGVVLGTFGVERHRITWRGQAAHAGSTPMDKRRDALAGAAKLALEIRDIARRTGDGAVCTSGGVVCKPGIVTSVVETAEQLLDQRHLDSREARGDAGRGEGRQRAVRRRGVDRRRVGEDLVDRADPLRRDAARLLRGLDPRGRGHGAPAPLRPAPRRSRGVTSRGADGDAVRPEPARPLAHEARGHEGGAPRARRLGARPPGVEDDRLGCERRRPLTVLTARRSPAAVVAGLAVGGCLTWNVSNVGADADPLSEHYGVSLAAIGLLTTALFVTHLAVQLPAGRGADRFGSQRVALIAIAAAVVGNAVLLLDAGFELALLGRAVVGIGSGAAFVAGLDLVRAGGGGAALQGLYGGATMTGGGLALMIVPPLTDATSWRAPYWTAAALAVLAAAPTLLASGLPRIGHAGAWVLRDRELLPIGALQAATFGLAVVAGNWAVPLLERQGASSTAAGLAGGLILFVGIVTRPAGGLLAGRVRGRLLVGAALIGASFGALLLALGGPFAVSTIGSLVLGLAAGLPFAVIFAAAQRTRPDAPGAAIALVNACAVLTILVGTPLAGLAFELPSDGRLAFAIIAALSASALVPLRAARL